MARLAVVGTGAMGANHVRTARSIHEWTDVIAVDVDASRAAAVSRRYGARRATSLASIADTIDAAIVAVPSVAHEQVVTPLLRSGVHVLLEKPISNDIVAAQRIVDVARKGSSRVAVGHIERFNSAVDELLRRAPDAIHVEFRRVGPAAGGRVLGDVVSDLMIHDLDLLLALSKARGGTQVHRCAAQWGAGGRELCSVLIEMDDGLTVTAVASRVGQLKERTITMTCSDAVVTADMIRQSVSISRLRELEFVTDGGVRFEQSGTIEIPFLDSGEPLVREQRHFHEVVIGAAQPLVTLEDGLAAMKLVEEVRRQAGA